MKPRLYCFPESGNAYKAALTMQLAGYDYDPVFVDFFGGGTRAPAFLALNPMGEVPLLVEGTRHLSQSGAIQVHVAERTRRFLGDTPEDRDEVLRWLFWDNHKMSAQAGSLRFLMNFAPADRRPAEVIGWMTGRLRLALKTLNAHLETRDWIVGTGPTLADFACCSYLYYPEPFTFARPDWPAIDRWLTRIAALPGWRHPYDLIPGPRFAPAAP